MIQPGIELGGKYRIVRLIGEGGMGAVYEAEHVGIGRRVAVKVLHEKLAGNQQAVARFEREARAAAAIGHENIVAVFDVGTHQDLPFIVMEFLKGEPLAERMAAEGTMPVDHACHITGQILSALAATHAAGVIHRDLKPENVLLLSKGDGRDVVKVLDFGISKFRFAGDADRVRTLDGGFLGTPGYMAPEQWMGRRDIDHRTDLFSIGVLLYAMLTGELPFDGETHGELFLEIVQGTSEPPPPSEIDPRLPAGLDAIVLKAIQRKATDRYQTCQEFLEALRPFGTGEIAVVSTLPRLADPDSADPPRSLVTREMPTEFSDEPGSPGVRRRAIRRWSLAGAAVLATAVVVVGVVAGARSNDRAVALVRPRLAANTVPMSSAPTPPDSVRVELRGLPNDTRVLVDGVAQSGSPLNLARDGASHHIDIEAGGVHRAIDLVADRDQVLFVDVSTVPARPTDAPLIREPIRAVRRAAPAVRRQASGRATGVGEMNVTEEF